MSSRLFKKGSRFVALFVIIALVGTCFVGGSRTEAAANSNLSNFLKQMKDAAAALNQADQFYVKNKDVLSGNKMDATEKVKDTFLSLIEKGEKNLTAALRSQYSYSPQYISLFNNLKIYKSQTVPHEDGSGIDFVRTFVSENYSCMATGCQGAPISYIMQVKYMDGHADVFTTHGDVYGSDTSEIIDLRVIDRYGFFKNNKNEIMMLMQFNEWRGGGWNIKLYNLTKKKEEKLSDYIPLTSLPAALSKQLKGQQKSLLSICGSGECTVKQEAQFSITSIDEVNRTFTLGSQKIKLKNVSSTIIKPNLKKQKLNAVINAANKGTFPNIKITMESPLSEVKKVYGPLTNFEGGTYFLKSFQFEVNDNGKLSSLGTNPANVGLGALTLTDLEKMLQIKAEQNSDSSYLTLKTGPYSLSFVGLAMSKPIFSVTIYR